MGRRKGFTLIELLVVIAIIALLLAVVVPSLRKAKEAAKGVSCRSNVRQMSIAFGTYSVDNDGRIFPFSYVGEYGYWFRNIAPYLGDKDYQTSTELQTSGVMKVGICPNTKVQTDDNSGTAPDNKTTWYWGSENIIGSYGVNAWVLPDPDGHVSTWGGGAISAAAAEKRLFSQYAQIRGDVGVIADSFRMDCWPSTPSNVKVPTAKQLIELT
ncbi:MAG: type II secretion system protein, partial [Balneolaceae bacterium]|nr:type II secretion system protein [Balneolaceae bacterium]